MMRALVPLHVFMVLQLPLTLAAGNLLEGEWRVISVKGAGSFDTERTSMGFSGDGRFASTIGCNRLFAKVAVDGDRLTFGNLASTRMACVGALAELEKKYLAALGATRLFRSDGPNLTFQDEAGNDLVRFVRPK